MDESSSRRMISRMKRGENLVKSVMITNGVDKPSRRSVLLTTLASKFQESFIAALIQDSVAFKSQNERLRVQHIIQVLAGSSRYNFIKNVLRKFQVELDNDKSANFKEGQKPMSSQDSLKSLLNSNFVFKSTLNQTEEADPQNKDEHTEKKGPA